MASSIDSGPHSPGGSGSAHDEGGQPGTGSKTVQSTGTSNRKTDASERADAERNKLLTAAMEVLKRSGWWGFKVESVLRQAGLSTRSFYRHFEKKSDLLLALLEFELGGAAIKLNRVTAAADSPSGMTLRVRCGRSAASGGKSHSWVTATTLRQSPSANSISVAEGTRLAMRIRRGEDGTSV